MAEFSNEVLVSPKQVSKDSKECGGERRCITVNSACAETGSVGNAGPQSALEHFTGTSHVLLPGLRVPVQADEELLLEMMVGMRKSKYAKLKLNLKGRGAE